MPSILEAPAKGHAFEGFGHRTGAVFIVGLTVVAGLGLLGMALPILKGLPIIGNVLGGSASGGAAATGSVNSLGIGPAVA